MKKPKSFAEVRRYLSNVPAINCGGCGVAALAMYKWLKKNDKLHDDFKFVACYSNGQSDVYENNMRVLRDREGKAIAVSHLAIYHGSKIIDCSSPVYLPEYQLLQFFEPEWFIVNMIKNKRTWNDWFDRRVIPDIEKDLDIDLSDIKDED